MNACCKVYFIIVLDQRLNIGVNMVFKCVVWLEKYLLGMVCVL